MVPYDDLLRIPISKLYFEEQYEAFFIRDKYNHLGICLRLIGHLNAANLNTCL